MIKLLVYNSFNSTDTNYLKKTLGKYYDILFWKELGDCADKEDVLSQIEVLITSTADSNLLEKLRNIKIIQVPSSGIDNINLQALNKGNIQIFNSFSHSLVVAEYALSLMLSLVKKIHLHDKLMKAGTWWRPVGSDNDFDYISGSILNKKIGFIGFGHIGQSIAKLLSGFDLNYYAYDLKNELFYDELKNKTTFCSLNALVKNSDIVFISLPLNDKTENLINEDIFKIAKKESYWINISRGKIFEIKAIYDALANRNIGGLALDNWFNSNYSEESKIYPSKEYAFQELNNIVMSPYRAIYISDVTPNLHDVVDNMIAYATGKTLKNKIII